MNGIFDAPIDISIPLRFNGPQPNAYGVAPAVAEPVRAGSLIGDTRQGGSVNFERYTFIPHCNGTHTEGVGHITHERVSVRRCLQEAVMPAWLVSISPEEIGGELVMTKRALDSALGPEPAAAAFLGRTDPKAMIVRTLPNDDGKLTREYGEANIPPYFSADTMLRIVELGIKHLLVDIPSIDRIFDDGKLINHRIFWNVEEGSFQAGEDARMQNTITELIYVPNEVADGEYILNLQIAPFEADCAPSRPILFVPENC